MTEIETINTYLNPASNAIVTLAINKNIPEKDKLRYLTILENIILLYKEGLK
mgnify:CR=1 FL=1